MLNPCFRLFSVAACVTVLCAGSGLVHAIDDLRLSTASNASTDWLTYGHTYENQRFSRSHQSNRAGVC